GTERLLPDRSVDQHHEAITNSSDNIGSETESLKDCSYVPSERGHAERRQFCKVGLPGRFRLEPDEVAEIGLVVAVQINARRVAREAVKRVDGVDPIGI